MKRRRFSGINKPRKLSLTRLYDYNAGHQSAMIPLVFRLLSLLPLRLSWMLGASLGRLVWIFSESYRRKALAQLGAAGYDPRGPLPLRASAHAGRMLAELPALWFWPDAKLLAHCQSPSQSVLLEAISLAQRDHRGLLFITPHLGSFEVIPRYIAQHVPITVLFKPAKLLAVDRLLREARKRPGVKAVPADLSGVRALLRSLKRGEAVGLLPDQVPGEGDGRLAPFFGQPAWTMTLPQGLIKRANPIMLIAVAQRCAPPKPGASGLWQIHFENYEGDPSPQAINAALEVSIRRMPEQYLWSYNRYKGTETAKR